MHMNFIETGFELKEVADGGTFHGYAAVFGNLDSHRDIVQPGATLDSIKASKGLFPILADHWRDAQIGWNKSASEDSTGMLVHGELNLEVEKAREKHALAKQAMKLGAPIGLSIGYITNKYTIDNDQEVRNLLAIDVKEYSFVAFPSNTRANVLSIKSIADELGTAVTESPKALEALLREVGFSVSVSKKATTTILALARKDVGDDSRLRDVDEGEVKEMLEMMQIMNMNMQMEAGLLSMAN